MKMLKPIAALVLSALAISMPAAARADVTISTATTGPVSGDGGTFTVTPTGTITNAGGDGIVATSANGITTLTIDGALDVLSNSINNNAGSSITSIGISGTSAGYNTGLLNLGTVGSLTIGAGGALRTDGGTGLRNEGTFTGTIANAGSMTGFNHGLDNQATGQIFAITNSGLVSGISGLWTNGTIGTVTNEAGGRFQGTINGNGLRVDGGGIGTLLNSGTMTAYNGLSSNGAITTLTNSGSINGDWQGIGLQSSSSLGSFGNDGVVSGGGRAMATDAGATIGTLTNSGTFTGSTGIVSAAVTGTIRNVAGGLIEGTGDNGVYLNGGSLTLFENSGTITGVNNAIPIYETNIGTIDNKATGLIDGGDYGVRLIDTTTSVTTLTNAGTIDGGNAIFTAGTITSLTNSGLVNGTSDWGVLGLGGDSVLGTVTNTVAGTIQGANHGVGIYGTSGTLTNQGMIVGTTGYGLYLENGSLSQLTNSGSITSGFYAVRVNGGELTTTDNTGLISGTERAFQTDGGTTIGTITNSGTMTGGNYGVLLYGTTGTLSNVAGGRIEATTNDGVYLVGSTTLFSNAGAVSAGNIGAFLYGATTTVTNSGVIEGGNHGVFADSTSTTELLTNSGTLTGVNQRGLTNLGAITTANNTGLIQGYRGLQADPGSSFGTLTNSGTVTGAEYGMVLYATSGTVINADGGLIEATTDNDGIYHAGTTTSLTNDGRIVGVRHGIFNTESGTLSALVNTSTISGPGGAGVRLAADTTTDTITNSGVIDGTWGLYQDSGTIGTLTNSGTFEGTSNGIILGTTGTLSNLAGARIAGPIGVQVGGVVTSLSNDGEIAGGSEYLDSGIQVAGSGEITAITNAGSVDGYYGIMNRNESSIGAIVNSGTIQGSADGIFNDGSGITSLVNQAGGLISGTGNAAINGGGIDSIDNYGTIAGPSGISNGQGAAIGTLTNRTDAVISGTSSYAVYTSRGLTSLTNEEGGLIESSGDSAIRLEATVATVTNAGVIRSTSTNGRGLDNANHTTGNVTNSGTIQGGEFGSGLLLGVVTGTVTNTATGLIQGVHGYEINGANNAIVNAGQIRGDVKGIYGYYGIGTLVNQSGGVISGSSTAGLSLEDDVGTITNEAGGLITSADGGGVRVSNAGYAPGTLVNGGRVEGGAAGLRVISGQLWTVTNTGTIAYSGGGSGPAVRVDSEGRLGDVTGSSGPAIVSTGAGASLDGIILNEGRIDYGFTIENQNVVVSADGGGESAEGKFVRGVLNVVDGDLTFLAGRTLLEADVAVNSGTGTVFNEAVLAVVGQREFDGAFSQSAAGTISSIISGVGEGESSVVYGSILIGGPAAFGGTLDLSLLNGESFALAAGQRFDLFSFASTSGGFSGVSVDGVALAAAGEGKWSYDQLVLEEIWTPTTMSIEISAVPEPATIALALAGVACGGFSMWRRRKRA